MRAGGGANECCPVFSDRFFFQNFNDFFPVSYRFCRRRTGIEQKGNVT